MEGFGQTGEMQADDEAVRSDEGIDFSESESPMQLRKGIGGTGNGQVNGRIGGESDVETFGKARTKVVTVVFGGVRSEYGKDGDTKRFHKFPAEFAENGRDGRGAIKISKKDKEAVGSGKAKEGVEGFGKIEGGEFDASLAFGE